MRLSLGNLAFELIHWRLHILLFEALFWLGIIAVRTVIWYAKMNTFPCVLLSGKETNCACMDSKLQFLFLLLPFSVDSPATSVSTEISELQFMPPYPILHLLCILRDAFR